MSAQDRTPRAVATMSVPVMLTTLSPPAQLLALRLIAQHAESADGTVHLSPASMRRYRWASAAQLLRARRELERNGLLSRVLPYRRGTKARYRLPWLDEPAASNLLSPALAGAPETRSTHSGGDDSPMPSVFGPLRAQQQVHFFGLAPGLAPCARCSRGR